VALLGIAQRKIRASRGHIGTDRRPRKSLPTIVKTLGDRIQISRYEKGLLQKELAKRMGVTLSRIKALESDLRSPNDEEIGYARHTAGIANEPISKIHHELLYES
jgi:ribosome-binding protein aMBF1 (putative translation factor)